MDENKMIDDLVAMLDASMAKGSAISMLMWM